MTDLLQPIIEIGSRVMFYMKPKSYQGWNIGKGEWLHGIYKGMTMTANGPEPHTVIVYRKDGSVLITAYFTNMSKLVAVTKEDYDNCIKSK